jgi:hypothetical protein
MQWAMLLPVHPCSPLLLHNLTTWYHAALLKFMIIDPWHLLMKEILPMTLIMYHNNDSLLLVLQVLIVYSHMILTVLAMLVVFRLMTVVLDASNLDNSALKCLQKMM